MSSPTNASGTPKVVKPERNVGNEVCNNSRFMLYRRDFFLSTYKVAFSLSVPSSTGEKKAFNH